MYCRCYNTYCPGSHAYPRLRPDLTPLRRGETALALCNSLNLARHAERWVGLSSVLARRASRHARRRERRPMVVIGHVAAGTSRIRVTTGGSMLPNHATLVILEQFGTFA